MTESAAPGFTTHQAATHHALRLLTTRSRLRTATARRKLQVALGLIWLVDSALQYQPYMFTKAFVTQLIDPTIPGNPDWISSSQTWAAGVMIHHVALYNAVFATTQLLLAAAILWPRTTKLGLGGSAGWAILVWWFGEGLGGILTSTSPVMGAPGAAILYAFVALAIWPHQDQGEREFLAQGTSVADTGILGRYVPRLGWSVLWLGLVDLGLQSTNRSPSSLHDTVLSASAGEPGWITSLDRAIAAPLANHGTESSIALAALYLLVAAGVWNRTLLRPTLVLALLLAAALWAAEDFGGIFTGSGTDVNTGPLLALFALALWPGGTSSYAERTDPYIGSGAEAAS